MCSGQTNECVSVYITGIAFYLDEAELLSCKHHFHDRVQFVVSPGHPGEIDCIKEHVTYMDPYRNQTLVKYIMHLFIYLSSPW